MGQADTLAAKLADAAAAMTLPVADDAVVVSVLISRGDVRRVYAVASAHLQRSPKIQRFVRGQARLVALVGLLLVVGGLGLLLTRPVGVGQMAILAFAAVLLWIAWIMGRRPRHANAVAAAEARFDKQHFPECSYQQTTFIYGRDGCRAVLKHSAAIYGWEMVASVEVDDSAVLVNHLSGVFQILPVRAFVSAEEMRAAGAKLIAWLDESGHGDANRLRRYLRETPTACPFCKKSLDAERLQCSGCGEPVTRHLLPEVGIEPATHPPTVPGRVEG